MRFTIKAKLAITFGILVLMLAGAGMLSYTKLSALNDTITQVADKAAKRVELMGILKAEMVGSVKSEKDAILATVDEAIAKATADARTNNDDFRKAYSELYQLASDAGKRSLEKIKAAFDRRIAIQDEVFEHARKNSSERAYQVVSGDGLTAYKQLESHLTRMEETVGVGEGQLALEKFGRALEASRGAIKGYLASDSTEEIQSQAKSLAERLTSLRGVKESLRRSLGESPAAAVYPQFSEAFDAWLKVQERAIAIAAEAGDIKSRELSMGSALQATNEAMASIGEYLALVAKLLYDAQSDAHEQY
jgi:methyl-accepting chemotaxis protein